MHQQLNKVIRQIIEIDQKGAEIKPKENVDYRKLLRQRNGDTYQIQKCILLAHGKIIQREIYKNSETNNPSNASSINKERNGTYM